MPTFQLTRLGYYGPNFLNASGREDTRPQVQLNDDGDASGVTYIGVDPTIWLQTPTGISTLGIHDPEHTSSIGQTLTYATVLTGNGTGAGTSQGYTDGTASGNTAWYFDGSTTNFIGLTGGNYRQFDGHPDANVIDAAPGGRVVGTQMSVLNGRGSRATWYYDGGSTRRIGLVGAANTGANGDQQSFVQDINASGVVIGNSQNFGGIDGDTELGSRAWMDDGAVTTPLGLTDPDHTRAPDGLRESSANSINSDGDIVGYSVRYSGAGAELDYWLYDGQTYHPLGLRDAAHTRSSDGLQSIGVTQLNDSGKVIGTSARYNGTTASGSSAWVYTGAQTIQIGLVDAEHTTANGSQVSRPTYMNLSGFVAGTSTRFDGSQSAWIYDGSTSKRIGLFDAAHTSANGAQNSSPAGITDDGRAWGSSMRYDGANTPQKTSAWVYDGTTSVKVGLNPGQYPSAAPITADVVLDVNTKGQAVGYSTPGPLSNSVDSFGFFYDPANGTVPLIFSQNSIGDAATSVSYLGNDGLVVGTYSKYTTDTAHTTRAFAWTLAGGFRDLNSMIEAANPAWTGANTTLTDSTGKIIMNANHQFVVGLQLGSANASRAAFLFSPLPGDYDYNGTVDTADYALWRTNDGTPNGYDTWRSHFGMYVATPIGSALAEPNVPEPGSLALCLLAGVSFNLRASRAAIRTGTRR
jgi:hypothetical protein